jgi:hypothetical protein
MEKNPISSSMPQDAGRFKEIKNGALVKNRIQLRIKRNEQLNVT